MLNKGHYLQGYPADTLKVVYYYGLKEFLEWDT